MTEIQLREVPETAAAVVRETVPMNELTAFFDRAFRETMAAIQEEGLQPAGPPFAKYYGVPGDTVDVEAGFPVAGPFRGTDGVTAGSLPGGRIAEAVHVGPYETLSETYRAMGEWMHGQGLSPGNVMWESYLTDPSTNPDPATWQTEVFWPVA